ncbi:MAG: gliding motility-associated C-terminal domain-containing protein [Saprospiraceae bacterium]|nr:gliding motility-associated C-terminal domain-containing protein [Saprospiraceae bacterium]
MSVKSFLPFWVGLLMGWSAVAQTWQATYTGAGIHSPSDDTALEWVCPLAGGGAIVCSYGALSLNEANLLIGLNSQGDVVWRRLYRVSNPPVSGSWVETVYLYPLPNGNALVLFHIKVPGGGLLVRNRTLIAEISANDGSIVWQRYPGTNDTPIFYSYALMRPDGIYLGGRAGNALSIAKLSFSGDLLWHRTYSDGAVGIVSEATRLALSSDGHLYATVRNFNINDITDYFSVLKFTANGDWIWGRRYRVDNGARKAVLSDLAVSQRGEPFILGYSYLPGPVSFVPFFLRLNGQGNVVSAWRRPDNPGTGAAPQDIIPIGGDEYLLCFDISERIQQYVRYDLDLGVRWVRNYEVPDLVYVHYKTMLAPDGYLWSVGQRLNLSPLGRISVVTRSDEWLFERPSCCLKEGTLSLTDYASAFQATSVTYSPQANAWPLESLSLTFTTPNINRQWLCQTQSLAISLSDTVVCTGGCLTARAGGPNIGAITWQVVGQAPITSDQPVSLCFNRPGEHWVTAWSKSDSCRRAIARVRVFDLPAPTISVSDSMVCPGECVRFRIDTVLPGYTYRWSFEGGKPDTFTGVEPPEVCYAQSGRFQTRVQMVGCNAEGAVSVVPDYQPALVANAFTPDGDGTNDRFFPRLRCPADPYRFVIYNRWGQKVFESLQSGEGWDGTQNGAPAPSDVYVWVLELRDRRDDGQLVSEILRGEVVLLR